MSNVPAPVRVRFAPSPTGELHVGVARTALYDFLLARHTGGQMMLRIEDTDQKRFVPGSMDRLIGDLKWLGIEIDEGPIIQSEHADRHRAVAHELVSRGAAYYEFGGATTGGERPEEGYQAGRAVYRGADRDAEQTEAKRRVDAGEPFVVRLKVPVPGKIAFTDAVRGRVEFDLSTIDDAVLLKSDGMATYHLAAMVDDHDMAITHVLRSEEWLPSTPKHLLIFQAMGWDVPIFVHLSQLLAPDGKKLSKRIHGEAVWVSSYRNQGYLPEALINYLALLGWNPGQDRELMTRTELIEAFSLARVHKAGAKFDQVKLDAFQRYYVKQLTNEELSAKISAYLTEQQLARVAEPQLSRVVTIVHDRLGRFDEFPTLASWVDRVSEYAAERLIFRRSTAALTSQGLTAALEKLESAEPIVWDSVEVLGELLAAVVAEQSLSNGDVFWPVRVALTSLEQSPSPTECLWVLGRAESLTRLQLACSKLETANPRGEP